MSRLCAALVLLVLLALTAPATSQAGSVETGLVKRVNTFRARHHLPKLHASRSLMRSARAYARHLMRTDTFGHASRIHASRRFHTLGETLAFRWGWGAAPRPVLSMWAHSAPHRALLLNSRFGYIGIGRSRGRYHGGKATIWVAHLGR
jgi:uncharacterized protein YkwD